MFFVFGVAVAVFGFMGVIYFILWWINSTVHYATSGTTHCGQFIHAHGGYMVRHTTIKENVTCWSCKAKLAHLKRKHAGT